MHKAHFSYTYNHSDLDGPVSFEWDGDNGGEIKVSRNGEQVATIPLPTSTVENSLKAPKRMGTNRHSLLLRYSPPESLTKAQTHLFAFQWICDQWLQIHREEFIK